MYTDRNRAQTEAVVAYLAGLMFGAIGLVLCFNYPQYPVGLPIILSFVSCCICFAGSVAILIFDNCKARRATELELKQNE